MPEQKLYYEGKSLYFERDVLLITFCEILLRCIIPPHPLIRCSVGIRVCALNCCAIRTLGCGFTPFLSIQQNVL